METRSYYVLRLVVYVPVAFCFGACIVLILNALNHGGWFALLSGLFGAMLFYVWALLRILFGPRLRVHPDAGGDVKMQTQAPGRVKIAAAAYGSIIFFSLLGIAAVAGLYALPGQSQLFALLSAILGLMLCICLLTIVASVLTLFLIRSGRIN